MIHTLDGTIYADWCSMSEDGTALSWEADMEYAMIDATVVKVHRYGQAAKLSAHR